MSSSSFKFARKKKNCKPKLLDKQLVFESPTDCSSLIRE